MKKKTKIIITAVILLAAAAAAGIYIWKDTHKAGPVTLYGNVDIRTVNTGFRIGGRLAELHKEEGDAVTAGELLAVIDDEPFRVSLHRAKAQAAQARAAGIYADSNYRRLAQLVGSDAVSKDQFDSSKAAKDRAAAEWQQAKAVMEEAELNIRDARLYAPSAGTVMTRAVEKGTILAAGSTVYAVSLTDPVWIKAYIDEVNLGQAVPGRKVWIYTDSNPGHAYTGQIGFVSPTAEFTPKSVETEVLRTDLVYRLRIVVDKTGNGKADSLLRQGMPVTVRFAP